MCRNSLLQEWKENRSSYDPIIEVKATSLIYNIFTT